MTTNKKRGRPPKEKVSESDALIKCAFCRGTGFDRFGVPSKLSRCQTCQGRGKVYVPEPHEKCPACFGNGVYRYHRLTCSVCGGKGRVRQGMKRSEGRYRGKRECDRGDQPALDIDTGLPCIEAYGLGEVEKYKL